MRSDSAPPGVLDADFTTCSAAQRIGASATGTPSWLARSSRNASVELPSVKRKITREHAPEPRVERLAQVRAARLRRPIALRGTSRTANATTSTDSTPGIAASQNTVRSSTM